MGNDICAGSVRKPELHREPARVGAVGGIRDVGNAGEVRESHRHGNRRTGEQRRLAQASCLGRRGEIPFEYDAFGVNRTRMMVAESAMQRVDKLCGTFMCAISSPGDRRGCGGRHAK